MLTGWIRSNMQEKASLSRDLTVVLPCLCRQMLHFGTMTGKLKFGPLLQLLLTSNGKEAVVVTALHKIVHAMSQDDSPKSMQRIEHASKGFAASIAIAQVHYHCPYSLAALLAKELKADLLVLMTDVEGLFTGPPTEPDSSIIPTYCPELHDPLIKFGSSSHGGRGGMVAKVSALTC